MTDASPAPPKKKPKPGMARVTAMLAGMITFLFGALVTLMWEWQNAELLGIGALCLVTGLSVLTASRLERIDTRIRNLEEEVQRLEKNREPKAQS
jgi:hypothetical protein